MTEGAKRERAAYLREWAAKNPDKIRANASRYWERKAAKIYGEDYIPPEEGQGLSEQAKQVRRTYYSDRRKAYPDENMRNVCNYWERKAASREE